MQRGDLGRNIDVNCDEFAIGVQLQRKFSVWLGAESCGAGTVRGWMRMADAAASVARIWRWASLGTDNGRDHPGMAGAFLPAFRR